VGKTTVAKALSIEFGLKYLSGGDILKDLAKEQGFQSEGDDWWDTEGGMTFLTQRAKNSEYDKQVDERLKTLFLEGHVVITSYTLPWLVTDGIKIWLAGSFENSAKRMRLRDKVTIDIALKIVKKRYAENKNLYEKLYNFEFGENLTVFDKIINTDDLNAYQVFEIAKTTVQKLL